MDSNPMDNPIVILLSIMNPSLLDDEIQNG
jgi:hypothetical protein